MSYEFMMKAVLTEDNGFILEIDGYKIHDSDWADVSYQLIQIARVNYISKEEREHERKELLKKYAILEMQ